MSSVVGDSSSRSPAWFLNDDLFKEGSTFSQLYTYALTAVYIGDVFWL